MAPLLHENLGRFTTLVRSLENSVALATRIYRRIKKKNKEEEKRRIKKKKEEKEKKYTSVDTYG